MERQSIKRIVAEETERFQIAIRTEIVGTTHRRQELLAHLMHLPVFTDEVEMSETDFYAIIADCHIMCGNLDAILEPLGFATETGWAWLRSTSAPAQKFRRLVARMIVESSVDYFASVKIFNELRLLLDTSNQQSGTVLTSTETRSALLSTRLDTCRDYRELSVRVKSVLQNNRYFTLGDVCMHSADELRRIPNFGYKSVNEIREFLAAYNLTLGCLTEEEVVTVRQQQVDRHTG